MKDYKNVKFEMFIDGGHSYSINIGKNMTPEKFIKDVNEIVNSHDLMALISLGAPYDEYEQESAHISKEMLYVKSYEDLLTVIHSTFVYKFSLSIAGKRKDYLDLARELWNYKERNAKFIEENRKEISQLLNPVNKKTEREIKEKELNQEITDFCNWNVVSFLTTKDEFDRKILEGQKLILKKLQMFPPMLKVVEMKLPNPDWDE